MIFKKRNGHPVIFPKNNLDYVTNYLNMTFGQVTMDSYTPDPVIVSACESFVSAAPSRRDSPNCAELLTVT